MRTVHVIGKPRFMEVIASKFGSLSMLLGLAGLDTSNKLVRQRIDEIQTTRDPIKISIHFRSHVWVLWVGEHPKGLANKNPIEATALPVDHSEREPERNDDGNRG